MACLAALYFLICDWISPFIILMISRPLWETVGLLPLIRAGFLKGCCHPLMSNTVSPALSRIYRNMLEEELSIASN